MHSDGARSPSATTQPEDPSLAAPQSEREAQSLALVIAWSAREPDRVGETALIPARHPLWILGRAPGYSPDCETEASGGRPVVFFRQRPAGAPGGTESGSAELASQALSRRQLAIRPTGDALLVHNIGQGRPRR